MFLVRLLSRPQSAPPPTMAKAPRETPQPPLPSSPRSTPPAVTARTAHHTWAATCSLKRPAAQSAVKTPPLRAGRLRPHMAIPPKSDGPGDETVEGERESSPEVEETRQRELRGVAQEELTHGYAEREGQRGCDGEEGPDQTLPPAPHPTSLAHPSPPPKSSADSIQQWAGRGKTVVPGTARRGKRRWQPSSMPGPSTGAGRTLIDGLPEARSLGGSRRSSP